MKKVLFIFCGVVLMGSALSATISDSIRVNSVGFHPDFSKQATVMGASVSKFEVVQVGNDAEVVYEGTLSPPVYNPDTNETVQVADFSDWVSMGQYRVKVLGLGSSAAFSVNPRVFRDSLDLQMLGFYGQRCGQKIRFEYQGDVFAHEACHVKDGYTDLLDEKGQRNGSGGWHDAGDYNKYVVNAAASLGMLFTAWDHHEKVLRRLQAGFFRPDKKLPYFLDEMKWEVLWMLKMQWQDGRVSHKLSAKHFDSFEMPHKEKEPRYFSDWSSSATAAFAGAMAMAFRAFEKEDPALASRCLGAARDAWTALQKYPGEHHPDQKAFKTGGYDSPDGGHRVFAAGELYRATKEKVYQEALIQQIRAQNTVVAQDWDWKDTANLGLWAYLSMDKKNTEDSLRQRIADETIAAADLLVKTSRAHGYGRDLLDYQWGSNGAIARTAILLEYAWRLTGNKKYIDTIQAQASYLYGRNAYNRSQITGEGYHPPMHPHHRPSGADDIKQPWPGLLVGGGWPTGISWRDKQRDASLNENAINWSAAMVYLLADLSGDHR